MDTAQKLVHDEVDILFGKDHGHAIHDEKLRTTRATMPSKKHSKEVQQVKSTHAHETKKTELPHATLLDFMETYADNCNFNCHQYGF